MAITPKRAAEIARARNLSLSDARAIAAMAESDADAETLADIFEPDSDEQFATEIARSIVARAMRGREIR